MSLHTQIRDEIKEAMKAKDAVRLGTLRGVLSNFTNELVSLKRTPQDDLSDAEALQVISRAVKQRKDSIEQFVKGGREDLAESEKEELAILQTYLPILMTEDEVRKVAEAKMAEMGGVDKNKVGQFMGLLMKDLKGKADGDVVKAVVDRLLTS